MSTTTPRHTGPVLRTAFDVTAYTRTAQGRIAVPELVELSARDRADLTYLWHLEVTTLTQMRAALASWTGNEARITAFLATWAYERYWFARALEDLLGACPATDAGARTRLARLRHTIDERVLPMLSPMLGHTIGEPVTAGHMARMAVLEGGRAVLHDALRNRVGPPVARVLERIAQARAPMVAFFRLEVAARIARSRRERLLAAAHLARPWDPWHAPAATSTSAAQALVSLCAAPATRRALRQSDAAVLPIPRRLTPSLRAVLRARAGLSAGLGDRSLRV